MGPTPLLANYQTTHQIKDNVSPNVNMGRGDDDEGDNGDDDSRLHCLAFKSDGD